MVVGAKVCELTEDLLSFVSSLYVGILISSLKKMWHFCFVANMFWLWRCGRLPVVSLNPLPVTSQVDTHRYLDGTLLSHAVTVTF